MTADEVRKVLRRGDRVRVVVGEGLEDPTCVLYLDDGMVMSESVAGWSSGTLEPVCGIDSTFLEHETLAGKYSIEALPPGRTGWEPDDPDQQRRAAMRQAQEQEGRNHDEAELDRLEQEGVISAEDPLGEDAQAAQDQIVIEEFFSEFAMRVQTAPDPEYKQRLLSYEPMLRRNAVENPRRFAQTVIDTLEQFLRAIDQEIGGP